MTPAEIMAALEKEGPLPRAALEAAGEAREAMVPLFLDEIERLTGADLDAADDAYAFIFVYYLLAEWRETRAYRPLLRLLRRDPVFVDALMGDAITEAGARGVVSLFDGDPGPIFETALDAEAEEYVRGQMFGALAMIAAEHPPLRPAVEDFLRRFPAAATETTPDIVWDSWAFAIADLGLDDMTPAVRRVFDEGLIDARLARFEDFEADLADALRTGRPARHGRRGPIVDAIAELSGWYCFSEAYFREQAERDRRLSAGYVPGELPFVRGETKVGRNDPCPCGSGKKFKKCCLQ